MAEERIDIVVSQRGATEVKRDLDQLGNSAQTNVSALEQLKSAMASMATPWAGPRGQ
jgi:hypothetical protein